jgi:hypothetical protein
VNYGEACASVDWGGEGPVWAAHGRAVRGRSGRGRRRRSVVWALGIDTETGGIERRREGNAAVRKRPRVKARR